MNKPIDFWHKRFLQQAHWTQTIRQHLISEIDLGQAGSVLEVGSGTGVIAKEITSRGSEMVIGLDLDIERLRFGRDYAAECLPVAGDGIQLPIKDNGVDACVCHFLLLWVSDPLCVLQEMARVVRDRGWVLALAEPDYGGRIDYPPALEAIGEMQMTSLIQQGATPQLGRRLLNLFLQAGLANVKAGILGGQWSADPINMDALDHEWSVMQSDIDAIHEQADLDAAKQAWLDPGRILYVPTFYAMGQVAA